MTELALGAAAVQLAHTRLAIVDLTAAGDQPIFNEDESLVIVFNGEIYNSPDLRRYCEAKGHRFRSGMDGEVIVHLWEEEGPASLNRLNGIFAVAVADLRSGELYLARDPVGVKPLFFCVDDATADLWFASELRALRAAGAPIGPLDTVALAQFLSFLWIPDPRTPHRNAQSLLPGHALRWTPDGTRVFRYGEPLHPPRASVADPAGPAELEDRLGEAVTRQLMADVPIGLMASGGVDSGLLWWATRSSLERCFTIVWPSDDGGERLGEDEAAVRSLHERFGTPVQWVPGRVEQDGLPPSGDLFADPAYELTRSIAAAAQEARLKVLLAGQGGDELFGGYRRHAVAPLVAAMALGGPGNRLARWATQLGRGGVRAEYGVRLLRAMAERDPFRSYMQLCTYSTAADRARALGCGESEVDDDVVWAAHRTVYESLPAGLSPLRRALALDLLVYLPGLGLAYMDRGGMEHGVEIRVPWLDLELVRWALTLPDSALVSRGRSKRLPRAVAARRLSAHLGRRAKRGFAAPVVALTPQRPGTGERGFRQERYFGRACEILQQFRLAERAA